jgi:UDPglucose 6-dehydrogenase
MVRIGIGSDMRIGKRFLFPGIGYGGSCFPKDVKALIKSASDKDYEFHILNAVETVNEDQKTYLIPKIKAHYNGNLKGMKIALWGLAFKPNTDDIREAPALYLIEELVAAGASICAFDPEAMPNVKEVVGDKIDFTENMYDAIEGADCLIIATEWSEFRNPNFERMEQGLKEKVIFDGRNVYALDKMEELGYTYYSIGRRTIN